MKKTYIKPLCEVSALRLEAEFMNISVFDKNGSQTGQVTDGDTPVETEGTIWNDSRGFVIYSAWDDEL